MDYVKVIGELVAGLVGFPAVVAALINAAKAVQAVERRASPVCEHGCSFDCLRRCRDRGYHRQSGHSRRAGLAAWSGR